MLKPDFYNRYRIVLLINMILFLASLFPLAGKYIMGSSLPENANASVELYDPALSKLDNIDKLISYIDAKYARRYHSPGFDTAHYVSTVSETIKYRFYHGLAQYRFFENWIAVVASELIWSDLSAVVEPNDILRNPEGLCSQQSIVFMEVLKRKGIKVRKVGLGYVQGPGHFLNEVYYNNDWHLYDTDKEPEWNKITHHHQSIKYYMQHKDSLYKVYENKMDKTLFNKLTENVEYGEIGEFPAKNMLFFHRTTKFITYILPFILGSVLIYLLYKKKF